MPKYLYKNFNEYWKALDHVTRPLLAKLSGLSYNHLCRLASGDRKATLKTWAKLYKVDRHITFRLMRPDLAGKRRYVSPGRKKKGTK